MLVGSEAAAASTDSGAERWRVWRPAAGPGPSSGAVTPLPGLGVKTMQKIPLVLHQTPELHCRSIRTGLYLDETADDTRRGAERCRPALELLRRHGPLADGEQQVSADRSTFPPFHHNQARNNG